MPLMTAVEIETFLTEVYPAAVARSRVTEVDDDHVVVRLRVGDGDLRPGGTVSGPTLMALADQAMYVLVLSAIGPVALAVTTDFTIHFLRRPPPADLEADARMLKLGRRLVVADVMIRGVGDGRPLAHATGTYSIPPTSG